MVALTKSPSLPTEVWLDVFELAVFVPNAFDTHAPDPFAYPGPWTQDQIQEGLRASLTTKLQLTLVCKTWNALATPLLYRAIFIDRGVSVPRLLWTLNSEDATATLKGRWTMRLDIRLWDQISSAIVKELLQLLPCLQIIVQWPADHWSISQYALLDALAMRINRSVYVLDVSGITFLENICIKNQPLRVLRIHTSHIFEESKYEVAMPDIEYLDVPYEVLRAILESSPPSISPSFLCLSDIWEWDVMEVPGSTVFGDHITSLELYDDLYFSYPPILRNIIFTWHCEIDFPNVSLPPSIERLGIRIHNRTVNKRRHCKRLCAFLFRAIILSPSIKVIRIIGEPTLANVVKNHSQSLDVMQKSSARLWLKNGVRFEDSTGRLFHEDNSLYLDENTRLELSPEDILMQSRTWMP